MSTERIGIIMNGITGRMGTRQHLARSIMAIREQGGVQLDDGRMLMPEPLLVGRNESKLQELSEAHGGLKYTTDLAEALRDPDYSVYFDSQTTNASKMSHARLMLANTSTARNPLRAVSPTQWRCTAMRSQREYVMALCRTNCSCRDCGS